MLSRLFRGKLTTLAFHKVPVARHVLTPAEMDLDAFKAVLQSVTQVFRILPLEEALTAMRAGSLPVNAACITFDDGYPDWSKGVVPVLQQLGLHATFFVTSGQLDGQPMWNERILHAVAGAPDGTPGLLLPGSTLPLGFEGVEERRRTVVALERTLKYCALADRECWLQVLERHTHADVSHVPVMNLADLRDIHAKGFGIGAHSISHPILRLCDEREAYQEIGGAKEHLEALIRGKVCSYAYPNGIPDQDFGPEHVQMVQKAGYQFALTTQDGVASATTSLLQIPRFTPWGPSHPLRVMQLVRNLMREPHMLKPANSERKRALMVAFHFPPQTGSSGILRTLNFVKHLPAQGWDTSVLTVTPGAFEEQRSDLISSIPPQARVLRAFALDSARHLSIKGKYLQMLALPDRWSTWWFSAVLSGLREIRRQRPQLIWSTYPITTAHLIGRTLARLSGLPWVADFRDPMINGDYPSDLMQRRVWQWLERGVMKDATRCVFTTERAAQTYRDRYPHWAYKCTVVENGYDEDAFQGNGPLREGVAEGQLLLLHSGIMYPRDRDPSPFFAVIRQLLDQGLVGRDRLKVRFRAPKHAHEVMALAEHHGLQGVVEVAPPIPYRQAIAEMMGADLLLVFQGSHFNAQIPAKIYEYLRTGQPIFALVDPAGDTASQLRKFQGLTLCDIRDGQDIAQGLQAWLSGKEGHLAARANMQAAQGFSRRSQAGELSALMDACIEEASARR